MLFNSRSYALFLPIVFALYWILPARFKWILLLISSYYFYMSWNPEYVLLILGTTVVSYVSGLRLEEAGTDIKRKKRIVALTVIICLGVLFVFKYLNFALQSVYSLMAVFSLQVSPWTARLLLPVGISFYTFQTLGYVIDVYRGTVKAERHFGIYATFISFFPQLVAGPIERTGNLLPQIRTPKPFDEQQAEDGLKLILWGLFKKLVIADYISRYVDVIYTDPFKYKGLDLILAVFFFTLQIYCDFSGYSSIAIGSAKLLGIDLMQNFASPYFATSIRGYWARWHISLSTWFRDYVYIPLGGNRHGRLKKYRNLMITFLVSGLWHGASWTFVIWGGIHGLAQVLEDIGDQTLTRFRNSKIGSFLSWMLVFAFCNLAWIFFRADTLKEAMYVMSHLFDGITQLSTFLTVNNGLSPTGLVYSLFFIGIMVIVDFFNMRGDLLRKINVLHPVVKWCIWISLAVIVVIFSQKGAPAEFVYFQF